jgi:hypothetical protein
MLDENGLAVDTTHLSPATVRRIQFIEIHEQPWFPSFLRDGVTDALQFGFNLFKTYGSIAPRLQSIIDSEGSGSIVDLCSGGGGPWLDLSRKLHGKDSGLQIWLTDKYPNHAALKNVEGSSENRISYYPEPVDVTNVPRELKGLRTMFTSFHHFAPDTARAILQNAVDARSSICVFEISRRSVSTIALTLAFVFALGVGTPWIRPFRWSRLFWTYVVPVIPGVLLFDGVVSCLRTYSPKELREIVDSLDAADYQWDIDMERSGRVPVTFLIGRPREQSPESIP